MKYLWTLFTLLSFTTAYATSDTDFQKVITEYGTWSIVINFMDVSKPQCQVKGVAATGDGEYIGSATVWKQQWEAKKDAPVAEVGLFKRINLPIPIGLKNDLGIHTLMTKNIGVKGLRREVSHHMALFNIEHGMIESNRYHYSNSRRSPWERA
jgi:hypothetical protein